MNLAKKKTRIVSKVSAADTARRVIVDSLAVALVSVLFIFSNQSAQAQTEKLLYAFTEIATGLHPASGSVRDKQGNIYGTTYEGGNTNCGGLGCGTDKAQQSSGILMLNHAAKCRSFCKHSVSRPSTHW